MNKLKVLLQTETETDNLVSTIRKALPFSIEPEGAQEAVLLLHGYTGNPSELLTIGRSLAEAGYAVSAPRHPGHGSNRIDFMRSRADDWLRSSLDAYLDLRAKYPIVHVLGHSMGGLLASAVAISFNAPKLILLAPAFLMSAKGLRWTPLLSRFKKVIVRKRPVAEMDRSSRDQLKLHEEYWSDDILPCAAELYRLSKLCRRRLDRLRSKTYVIVGSKDTSVPPQTAELVKQLAVNVESMDISVMKDAGHRLSFDDRAEETSRLILAWMNKE